MEIEYLIIRNKNRDIIGILDSFKSVIWHSVYFGVGDFEVYAPLESLDLLNIGYYVCRNDDIETGIIEKIEIINNEQDGKMIVASGRFLKSILDRRIIYNLAKPPQNTPTILRGNVEEACRQLVMTNAINCPFSSLRNIDVLKLGDLAGLPAVIVEEDGDTGQKQVSYQPLLEYTDELLQEYGYGSIVLLDDGTKEFKYVCFAGEDRTADSPNPVIFSQEFDNLAESDYTEDDTLKKNFALIGGAGEDLDRFFTTFKTEDVTGLERREVFIDASSINREYDDEGTQKQYTNTEYRTLLRTQASQEMREMTSQKTFTGTIITSYGQYIYNRDFFLGDIVTVQDNDINKYSNVRITEVTEIQDENGYNCEVMYQ